MARVARVDLPQRSVLKPLYAKAGFADAFAIDLPGHATDDAGRLAAHILMGQPRWAGWRGAGGWWRSGTRWLRGLVSRHRPRCAMTRRPTGSISSGSTIGVVT